MPPRPVNWAIPSFAIGPFPGPVTKGKKGGLAAQE